MAVIINKKFWNGSEFNDIAKVVFTSPNFTSPAVAGTRSHMPPGGKYIGTWFEAVDFMYRKFINQNYTDYPNEMEGYFGRMYVNGEYDFTSDTTMEVYHPYSPSIDFTGAGNNVIYFDKDNYGRVVSHSTISGTDAHPVYGKAYKSTIQLFNLAGDRTINDWISATVSGNVGATASGMGTGNTNMMHCDIVTSVSGLATDYYNTLLAGTISGTVSGTVSGTEDAVAYVDGTLSGTLYNEDRNATCYVDCAVSGTVSGPQYGTLVGNITGELYSEDMEAPIEPVFFQQSNTIISGTAAPLPRRQVGDNSVLFEVTFGEAYNCRLTAWDDDTHSTTSNRMLDEEHYRVDAAVFRSNLPDMPHTPLFAKTNNMLFPPVYDFPLKGNESYYGDFDMIFAIEVDEFGEYLVFCPRLYDINATFTPGSYDFITTLHYQYT